MAGLKVLTSTLAIMAKGVPAMVNCHEPIGHDDAKILVQTDPVPISPCSEVSRKGFEVSLDVI